MEERCREILQRSLEDSLDDIDDNVKLEVRLHSNVLLKIRFSPCPRSLGVPLSL